MIPSVWGRLRRKSIRADLGTVHRLFEEAGRGGEASAGRRAAWLADAYRELDADGRRENLEQLATEFGTQAGAVDEARRLEEIEANHEACATEHAVAASAAVARLARATEAA